MDGYRMTSKAAILQNKEYPFYIFLLTLHLNYIYQAAL